MTAPTPETLEREARELVGLTDTIVAYAMGFDHDGDVTFADVDAAIDAYRTAVLAAAAARVEAVTQYSPANVDAQMDEVEGGGWIEFDAALTAIRGEASVSEIPNTSPDPARFSEPAQ